MPGSAVADIQHTYGVTFIGLLFSTVLYGTTVTQMWTYYCQYRNRDPMVLKGFIALLFLLDTIHTVLCAYSVYWYLVLNFGNVDNLDLNMWSINVQANVNALIGLSVKLFYARRVYIISRSIVIPVIVVILGGICFVLGLVFTVKAFALKRYSRYSALTWVICSGMGSAALADVVIALAMCWYLYRKRTGFSRTDSIIMRLMSYSINSGLVNSVLATAMLVCFLALRSSLMWQALFWLVGKCYVISFLSMLNNRDALRERSSDEHSNLAIKMSAHENGHAHKYKTGVIGPTAVTISVHQTIISDLTPREHNYDDAPGPEKPKGTTTSELSV